MKRRNTKSRLENDLKTDRGIKYQFKIKDAEHAKKAIDGLFMLRSAIVKYREQRSNSTNAQSGNQLLSVRA